MRVELDNWHEWHYLTMFDTGELLLISAGNCGRNGTAEELWIFASLALHQPHTTHIHKSLICIILHHKVRRCICQATIQKLHTVALDLCIAGPALATGNTNYTNL